MVFPSWRSIAALLAVLLAVCIKQNTWAELGKLEEGVLPDSWINGINCNTEQSVQTHAYNKDLFILRQSLCTNFEAPFIYLIFGTHRVLMLDTGAGGIPIRNVVDDIVARWLEAHGRSDIELIVSHSHSHGDHYAGDDQFKDRPNTKMVGLASAAVQDFFAIQNWPTDITTFDLGGGRIVDVIPIPGHQDAHIALYDRRTGLLFTGDSLYPGRLYFQASNLPLYRESIQRLLGFIVDKEVRYILGTHIEMTSEAGVDFPFRALIHPNEHRLELQREQLVELHDALVRMGNHPMRETHHDFIICPLPDNR